MLKQIVEEIVGLGISQGLSTKHLNDSDSKKNVDGLSFHGKSVSTDIINATVHAYLQALNKALSQNRGRRRIAEKGVGTNSF